MWSLADGSLVTSHPMNRAVKAVAWTPDSAGIVAGGDSGAYFMRLEHFPQ